VPVLPYGRDTASADISIHTFPDGGVAVSIPSALIGRWMAFIGVVPVVLAFAFLTWFVRQGLPFSVVGVGLGLFVAAFAAFVLTRGTLVVARWGRPFVVGVDPTSLYVDDPLSIRRLRRWPRHWVADVRLTTEKNGKGRDVRYIEVLLTGQPPLKLCQDRGEWDRKRVAAVLRRAAGLPGPPPEHVQEHGRVKHRHDPPVIRGRSRGRTHSARRTV
jgi:hypothetical protein